MQPPLTLRFADAIAQLGWACRRSGWMVPDYRSPPGLPGTCRTMRRRPDGSVMVAVLLHSRAWVDVVTDLIEGVIVANRLVGADAQRCRTLLTDALVPPKEAPMAA